MKSRGYAAGWSEGLLSRDRNSAREEDRRVPRSQLPRGADQGRCRQQLFSNCWCPGTPWCQWNGHSPSM